MNGKFGVLKYLTYVQVMAHLKQGSHISLMSKSTNLLPEVVHLLSSPHGLTTTAVLNPTCTDCSVLISHCGGSTCKLKAKRRWNSDTRIKRQA